MKFTCTRCTSEIKIIGPYTSKLERTTRLIASETGSKRMTVKNMSIRCTNCGSIETVLSPVTWLDLLLADLSEGCLLVIRSLEEVHLIYHTEYDVNRPLYKLDQVEIKEFVSSCGITFSQIGTSGSSTVIANVTVGGDLNGSLYIGSNNQNPKKIKIKGREINVIVLGNGISFFTKS